MVLAMPYEEDQDESKDIIQADLRKSIYRSSSFVSSDGISAGEFKSFDDANDPTNTIG